MFLPARKKHENVGRPFVRPITTAHETQCFSLAGVGARELAGSGTWRMYPLLTRRGLGIKNLRSQFDCAIFSWPRAPTAVCSFLDMPRCLIFYVCNFVSKQTSTCWRGEGWAAYMTCHSFLGISAAVNKQLSAIQYRHKKKTSCSKDL